MKLISSTSAVAAHFKPVFARIVAPHIAKMSGLGEGQPGVSEALGINPPVPPKAAEMIATVRSTSSVLQEMSLAIFHPAFLPGELEPIKEAASAKAVVISRDSQNVLDGLLRSTDPALLSSAMAASGGAESIVAESFSESVHFFEDGSGFVERSVDRPAANRAIEEAIWAGAVAPEQFELRGEAKVTMTEFEEFGEHFKLMVASVSTSPALTKQLMDLWQVERTRMAVFLSANRRSSEPFESAREYVESLAEHVVDGDWSQGLSVSVDGKPCATPDNLLHALGGPVPPGLEEAVAKLRANREAREAASAPAAPAPKAG